jgi:hypothetical protein
MTPRLIPYPVADERFEAYNHDIQHGFKNGKFGFAIDVWRDGEHLWKSYEDSEGEDSDLWYRRNNPEMQSPDFEKGLWGFGPYIGGMDRFLIPTRAALFMATSLPSVESIALACLGIAQLPHKAENRHLVPNPLSMRQAIHQSKRYRVEGKEWRVFKVMDAENRIMLRLVVATAPADRTENRARYVAEVTPKDEPHNFAQWEVSGPDVRMDDSKDRKPITTLFKDHFGLTGHAAPVMAADPVKFRLNCTTIKSEMEIRKVELIPGEAKDRSPFDTVS